jgi:hypothetical protein
LTARDGGNGSRGGTSCMYASEHGC